MHFVGKLGMGNSFQISMLVSDILDKQERNYEQKVIEL